MKEQFEELLNTLNNLNKKFEALEKSQLSSKTVLSLEEFCIYTGYSKSRTYKLTSSRLVPYSKPNDKAIFFSRALIDEWLLKNPIRTISDLKSEVKMSKKQTKFKF